MFDKSLVHAIIGGKDPDCGSAELSVNLGLTRGHGCLLPDLSYFRAAGGHPEGIHFTRPAEILLAPAPARPGGLVATKFGSSIINVNRR
jgi:hypothetical protein